MTEPLRVIKRYSNRKLYDTQSSAYVTLDEIAEMIREGLELQVIDNRSKEDLTSVTLAQIIFEQQKNHSRPMPLAALRGIIQNSSDLLRLLNRARPRAEEPHEPSEPSPPWPTPHAEPVTLAQLASRVDTLQRQVERHLEALPALSRDIHDALRHITERLDRLDALAVDDANEG